jgi:hypothetical protein
VSRRSAPRQGRRRKDALLYPGSCDRGSAWPATVRTDALRAAAVQTIERQFVLAPDDGLPMQVWGSKARCGRDSTLGHERDRARAPRGCPCVATDRSVSAPALPSSRKPSGGDAARLKAFPPLPVIPGEWRRKPERDPGSSVRSAAGTLHLEAGNSGVFDDSDAGSRLSHSLGRDDGEERPRAIGGQRCCRPPLVGLRRA